MASRYPLTTIRSLYWLFNNLRFPSNNLQFHPKKLRWKFPKNPGLFVTYPEDGIRTRKKQPLFRKGFGFSGKSHQGKRKIIFKSDFWGDTLVHRTEVFLGCEREKTHHPKIFFGWAKVKHRDWLKTTLPVVKKNKTLGDQTPCTFREVRCALRNKIANPRKQDHNSKALSMINYST